MAAHQAPRSLGFSRQEHWSGVPFPCILLRLASFLQHYLEGRECGHRLFLPSLSVSFFHSFPLCDMLISQDKHLGWFQFVAVTANAATNILIHTCLLIPKWTNYLLGIHLVRKTGWYEQKNRQTDQSNKTEQTHTYKVF